MRVSETLDNYDMPSIEENELKQGIEFLEKNLPVVDSKTFEAYSILNNDYSEILCFRDFNISKEKLDFYTARHYEIYSKKAEEILCDLPRSLVLSSGMFGGKTTLSFLILDELLKQDKNVELLIADVMGEDYITARSYRGQQRRSAERFGDLTDYQKKIEALSKKDIDVIFLDEFSFLNTKIVEDLQEMCFAEKKHLVLTGLNASYLGEPLPAFCEDSKILANSKVEQCYSFVTGFCEEEPLGTSTIRYVKINDQWVMDVGLLPLVVSKEKSHVVHYAPAMLEHTASHIFREYEDILKSFLYPSEEKRLNQEMLLENLSSI